MKFGVGQSVQRTEDERLLRGLGQYVDDVQLPDVLHAVVVRSAVAHAEIKSIETSAAAASAGVVQILTGSDLVRDGVEGLSCRTLFPNMHNNQVNPPVPALAMDKVRYVGAPVALVVAKSRAAARGAADLVDIEYQELPAAVTLDQATVDGAPILWDEAPGNIAFDIGLGDQAATDQAFRQAAHITEINLFNNRLSANSLEPRGALANYDEREQRLTLRSSTQAPHSLRTDLAKALSLPETAVRVVADDVGGGFGMKGGIYAEDVLVSWAALRLKRPVVWRADRTESLLADYHGRDQQVHGALAFDADGRITALRMRCDFNTGAHLSTGGGVPPMFAATLATGCYRVPVAHVTARAVFTNTSPTQPYRGAGRPEAAYLIEQLMDKAARETGRDRIELRRLNMIGAAEMPYKTPLVYTIDSGDYGALLDSALDLSGWADFGQRKAESAQKGLVRGIGIALHMENAGLANEAAEIRFDPGGSVTVLAGTFSHGQGHETVYAQMVSDWLGVPFDRIRILQGDTDKVPFGRGTVASRSMINGGNALRVAADKVIEKGRLIAGHLMEVAADDIVFEAGSFTVAGTDRSIGIGEIASISFRPVLPPQLGLGLSGQGDFLLQGFTFPSGCQIAEVEVDPQTGRSEIKNLCSVDDVGTVINPMLLDGQIVGGIAQGIGQALMEDLAYDPDSGQLLTGSFLDYAMPRAADMPPITFKTQSTPTLTNPIGVKGAGETGTVGATPAVISAIVDALAPLGVTQVALPATPEAIWTAISGVSTSPK